MTLKGHLMSSTLIIDLTDNGGWSATIDRMYTCYYHWCVVNLVMKYLYSVLQSASFSRYFTSLH